MVGKIKSTTFAPALREKRMIKTTLLIDSFEYGESQLMKMKFKEKETLKNKALFFLKSFGSLKICITFAVRPNLKNQKAGINQVIKQGAVF